ncbi:alpha/beta fold hydrolase [Streptomyces sp. NPDC049590]|uniref:alpha/beta fold hydrolase n=1 Tax=Streptomyces sp. NPDC049590 TaxID=3154834 RepID=UPI00343D1E64
MSLCVSRPRLPGDRMTAVNARTDARRTTVYIRETPVAYTEAGKGETCVLLLHGLGGTSDDWRSVMRELARRHRVVALDLPGYGDSGPIPGTSPAAVADFVWAFADVLGISRAAIMGHSEGGSVAVNMALQRPDRATRLVLVSAAGLGRLINPIFMVLGATPVGALVPRLAKLPVGPEALVAALALFGSPRPWRVPKPWFTKMRQAASSTGVLVHAVVTLRQGVSARGQENLVLDSLPQLPQPVLVAWGTHDAVLPVSQAWGAVRRLRQGRLALVPCAGHLLPIEAPDRLVAAVAPFLAEVALVTEGAASTEQSARTGASST